MNRETFQADKIIIATASRAMAPPIESIQKTGYITHIEALRRQYLPPELMVIGAGPIWADSRKGIWLNRREQVFIFNHMV